MGGQMASYMQLVKLDYALGGVMVLSGFPLPPTFNWPNQEKAEVLEQASYHGDDMRWFIWCAENDLLFQSP